MMEKKYSFWERLVSDTPSFFKQVQILGVGLIGLGTSLMQIQGVNKNLITILITTGSVMATIAQFAVKQFEPKKNHDEN